MSTSFNASLLLLLLAICPLAVAGSPAPTATPANPPAFQIERSAVHTIASVKLKRSYDLYVKLPPGYDKPENVQRKYPVLYLTDGPYTFQVASGVTRVPFNHGTFEDFILVGLSYAQGDDPVVSRERDLTPLVDLRSKSTPTGGGPAYLDFIRDEAIPLIEKTYRTDPRRRSLAGQSYGGLFGIWVMFNEPELFQNYILTSASLWYNKKAMFDAETAYAKTHADLKANLYMAIGSTEYPGGCGDAPSQCPDGPNMVAQQAEMLKRLASRKYKSLALHGKVVEGAFHTTTFPVGLLWALQDVYLIRK
ncbi:alpha/beta hydrolase-fold protein [Dokdonella sp.]|uniref:alpha/beta hydrolase n=1 Tax=Dokdonella sp. TaxID=2291710 RepID=UPI001B1FC81F|nr:alpha/beta hydrolase-fold protein [Dokdonella sp.]MBO9664982.1 alpha/beta hydrolase [Dokdonella sp.]